MAKVYLLKLEFLVATRLLAVDWLLALFVLCNYFVGDLFLLLIFDYKTYLRGSIGPLFPPLDLVIIDNRIPFVPCDLITLIGQHQDVAQMLGIRLVMRDILKPYHQPRYHFKLRLFRFSVMMGQVVCPEHLR
jgi:hypothetical protein